MEKKNYSAIKDFAKQTGIYMVLGLSALYGTFCILANESAFYAWKKSRKKYIESMGFKNILLIRRNERVALKKMERVRA